MGTEPPHDQDSAADGPRLRTDSDPTWTCGLKDSRFVSRPYRDVRLQRYQDAARHVHERSTTRVLGRRHESVIARASRNFRGTRRASRRSRAISIPVNRFRFAAAIWWAATEAARPCGTPSRELALRPGMEAARCAHIAALERERMEANAALAREQAVRDETQSALAHEQALHTKAESERDVVLGSTTGASPPRALGGRAAVTPEKLNSSQPARARRLDEGAGRLAVALVLSRCAVRMGYPGWNMAPAIAALRRRLTEWAAASPRALALKARRMARSAQPMR